MTDINNDLIKELAKGCKTQEDLFGKDGVIKQLTKQLLERMMNEELSHHLGYEKNAPEGKNSGNSRNGAYNKTIACDQGKIELTVPRDRNSDFEPQIVPKHKTRFTGLDDKIISLYSRGLTTRDIQAELKEMYGTEVSPTLISTVTDGVMDEVREWQSRALEAVYPIVYFDAIVVKIKENKQIINKAVYLALAVNLEGQKELLGLWVNQTEGAKFWMSVLTELKNRGVKDLLITCVDGLSGFPEAIEAVFPKATVQLCIVHQIRNSLKYVSYKDRKAAARDLKTIYQAATIDAAETALTDFAEIWDKKYPVISRQWLNNWAHLTPFFAYPPEIRRVIYTTNAIESLNMTIRKSTKNKRFFPSDDAAIKQIYLSLRNIAKKWTMPIRDWGSAMNRFMIEFEGRIPS